MHRSAAILAAAVVAGSALVLSVDAQTCSCTNRLTIDYQTSDLPNAAAGATMSMSLDTNAWEVTFTVSDVQSFTNGHVVPAALDSSLYVGEAFPPYVQNLTALQLWNPPLDCTLSDMDHPATDLGITMAYNAATCLREYTITFPILDASSPARQYCHFEEQASFDVIVNCTMPISSTRALNLTAPLEFISGTALFIATYPLPSSRPANVDAAIAQSLADCGSRYDGLEMYVDCRLPGAWALENNSYPVSLTPAGWLDNATCSSRIVAGATFIECRVDPRRALTAATEYQLTMTVTDSVSSNAMTFSSTHAPVNPPTAAVSTSLDTHVTQVNMIDHQFVYQSTQELSFAVHVAAMQDLTVTAVKLRNSQTPIADDYDLRANTAFDLVESVDGSSYVFRLRPAGYYVDPEFYKDSPLAVEVTFSIAGGGDGTVTLGGINSAVLMSGSLAGMIRNMTMVGDKYYYAENDVATLQVGVALTDALEIISIDMLNGDTPQRSHALTSTPEFGTVIATDATKTMFLITFSPAALFYDSNFYRHGPHSLNITFRFRDPRDARRQVGPAGGAQPGDMGWLIMGGVWIQQPPQWSQAVTPSDNSPQGAADAGGTSSSVSVAAAVAVACVVLAAAVIGAAVVLTANASKKREEIAKRDKEAAAGAATRKLSECEEGIVAPPSRRYMPSSTEETATTHVGDEDDDDDVEMQDAFEPMDADEAAMAESKRVEAEEAVAKRKKEKEQRPSSWSEAVLSSIL